MKVENFTETSEINELFDLFTYNKVKISYLSPVVLYSCKKLHKWILRIMGYCATIQF